MNSGKETNKNPTATLKKAEADPRSPESRLQQRSAANDVLRNSRSVGGVK